MLRPTYLFVYGGGEFAKGWSVRDVMFWCASLVCEAVRWSCAGGSVRVILIVP
jgi:hypothetical protein